MSGLNDTLEPLTTKARIGLVVVSASTVSELRYPKAVPEVGFLSSRMMLGGDNGLEALLEMEKNSSRAVEELASAGVDSIAYCCTVSGAQRGLEKDREFCEDMERQFGAPTTSTMLAAAEALTHLGIRRVVLTSPYPHSYHEAESRYLAEAGIETVHTNGMGFQAAAEFAAVKPEEIYRFCLEAWQQSGGDADGLFISCMNMDAMAAAQALEEAIRKPVVTSHTATLWRALALAGIEEPVRGYGRLLAARRECRTPCTLTLSRRERGLVTHPQEKETPMTTAERLNVIPLGEAMFTQRAIRRFKPDPIPDDVLEDIMQATIRAPNGGNNQQWHFIVVKDAELRRKLGELYHEAWWAKRADAGIMGPEDIPPGKSSMRSAMRLANEIGDTPVMVLICATAKGAQAMGSVIPSAQNMLLAARAFGIGGTITTLHPVVEERVHELFGIPDTAQVVYCMPLGYPRGVFGSVTRLPLTEVCGVDGWSNSYPG